MQIDTELSPAEASALLGMTTRHLRRLTAEGWFRKNAAGGYTLAGTVQGYIHKLRDDANRATAKASDNKVQEARAREIAARLAQREAGLIETRRVVELVDGIIGAVADELAGLLARFTRDRADCRRLEVETQGIIARAERRLDRGAMELSKGRLSLEAARAGHAVARGKRKRPAGTSGTRRPSVR